MDKCGKYRILERFGSGGGGTTYLAENVEDDGKKISDKTMYVVKIIKERKFKEEYKYWGKCFNEEIRIIRNLPDKNCFPKIYDFKEFDEQEILVNYKEKPYYVIDLYSKGSLFYYATSKLLLENKHCKLLFKKILEAFQSLHNSGICHLDIKLENILLDKKFEPIIIDFGSAEKFIDPNQEIKYNFKQTTKFYRCPEISDEKNYNGIKADIFSLGVILFFLVSGGIGFPDTNSYLYDLIKNANGSNDKYWEEVEKINNEFKEEKRINLNLSYNVKNLYLRMVAFEPSQRPSIEEILKDPWFQEINEAYKKGNEKEKEKLEKEYKDKFSDLCNIIKKKDSEIDLAEKKVNEGYKTKKGGENDKGIFQNTDIVPKKIPNDKILINQFIKIKGSLPYKHHIYFMNYLAEKIYNDLDGGTRPLGENLKVGVTFRENEENECKMIIQLFEYENGEYLLDFLRTKGSTLDYYYYVKEIKKIIIKKFL